MTGARTQCGKWQSVNFYVIDCTGVFLRNFDNKVYTKSLIALRGVMCQQSGTALDRGSLSALALTQQGFEALDPAGTAPVFIYTTVNIIYGQIFYS